MLFNHFEYINRIAKIYSKILSDHYQIENGKLHEVVSKLEYKLPDNVFNCLRVIASMRNNLAHKPEINFIDKLKLRNVRTVIHDWFASDPDLKQTALKNGMYSSTGKNSFLFMSILGLGLFFISLPLLFFFIVLSVFYLKHDLYIRPNWNFIKKAKMSFIIKRSKILESILRDSFGGPPGLINSTTVAENVLTPEELKNIYILGGYRNELVHDKPIKGKFSDIIRRYLFLKKSFLSKPETKNFAINHYLPELSIAALFIIITLLPFVLLFQFTVYISSNVGAIAYVVGLLPILIFYWKWQILYEWVYTKISIPLFFKIHNYISEYYPKVD